MKQNKRFFLLFVGVFFRGVTSADGWFFPGLKITSRSERGANESWRYFSAGGYTAWLERNALYDLRLSGSGEDANGSFAKRKASEDVTASREAFLYKNYPEEMVIDRIVAQVDTKNLLRKQAYHSAKAKIILHHTVTRQVTDDADAKASLQEMYKQHAITQGRGDIGYNFLIDPKGTIYEGRAGGKDVIGAHADWNNARTIGISMMGNYDIHKPSSQMWWSLKKLLLSVMLQYEIDPMRKQSYFTAINQSPWLVAATHTSLVGHGDTKSTACPGEHIESRLPELRTEMSALITKLNERGVYRLNQFRFLPRKLNIWMEGDQAIAGYDFPDRKVLSCHLVGEGISIQTCGSYKNKLLLRVQRESVTPSGQYALLINTDQGALRLDVTLVRKNQIDGILSQRIAQNPLSNPPQTQSIKTQVKIPVQDMQSLMNRQVGVLLYEPTTTLQMWEMSCESGCTVLLDNERISDARTIRVQPSTTDGSMLSVFVDLKKYTSRAVRLSNPRSIITFTNRTRGSDAYPLNYFRGDIAIQKEAYTTLDKKNTSGRTVVNHLPVASYLAGVAETVETQHPEKLRAMALLVKGYIFWYLGGNQHPNVPEGASFHAIDDPRMFQKYVGAGIENTTLKWQKAIALTAKEVISYDGYIPILPYFHCSAGFIRSAKERFGRTDTPWLVNKIDVATCESGTFEGHGVGMSGDGAEKLASKGVSYKQILRYYYEGVVITTFQ